MNLTKKLAVFLLTLAIAFSSFSFATVDTQAAAKTKTTTNVYDSKTGVCYPTKIRVGVNNTSNFSTYIHLLNEGDYVASVKTSSSKLIAKLTRKTVCTGNSYVSAELDGEESPKFKSRYGIAFYATKKGTYTATVTIKNKKKKTVCKKKITVYVDDQYSAIRSVKYAGKEFYSYLVTNKKSGTFTVSMSKGYKLEKIELGTYADGKKYEEYSPEPEYKTIKNKQKINLATSTKYTSGANSYEGTWYSYKSGYECDYLLPVTFVKVTYKDKKLGITRTEEYQLFYEN